MPHASEVDPIQTQAKNMMRNSEKDTYGLLNKIPEGMEFKKLTKNSVPCCCLKWQPDRCGILCMYYTVSKRGGQKKRIPLSEMEECVHRFKQQAKFDRDDLRDLCPIAHSDGGCAFAVIGRILEKFFGAEYKGHGHGFRMRE